MSPKIAQENSVVYWNGWFRKVKKGDIIEPFETIKADVPSNICWNDAGLGYEV